MKLVALSQSEHDQYENFIAAERGSFLQSWQWGEFQTTFNQKVWRFGLVDEEEIKLVGQFIEQTIPHLGGKYLYCPYGPVGNVQLITQFISEIKKLLPDFWFIRIEPQTDFPKLGQPTLRIQPGKTLVTNLSQSLEDLQMHMHSKTRYGIRLAEKHQVQIEQLTTDDQRITSTLDLLTATSKRQKFTTHPTSYYQKLVGTLQPSGLAKIYIATYEGKILNCIVMVDYQQTRTYLFGGSSDENKNVMAPYLLHWEAMKEAKANGLKFYDWWGIETATGKMPGFAKFKLRWGGEQISYPAPQDIVSKPVHYVIYKLLRTVNRLF